MIADDFHFTSPLDKRIDRKVYFERCWPNSANTADFKFIHLVQQGERVFVTYEGGNTGGNSFRNTEILTVRHGKLVDAEVYFGWSLPHAAPAGGFTNRVGAMASHWRRCGSELREEGVSCQPPPQGLLR